MKQNKQCISLKAIIPIKFCIKFDPPKIGLLYKRNSADKNRIYEIHLEKYLTTSSAEEIAQKIFRKHALMINEKTIKINQLKNLILKIQKNQQSSQEKQNVQLCEDSNSDKKKTRDHLYEAVEDSDSANKNLAAAKNANKLLEQEKVNQLNFAKKEKEDVLPEELIDEIASDFNKQKTIKNTSQLSKNNDNLFGESMKSDFLKDAELDELYAERSGNDKNNNIISEQDLNDIALEIDQMFSEKKGPKQEEPSKNKEPKNSNPSEPVPELEKEGADLPDQQGIQQESKSKLLNAKNQIQQKPRADLDKINSLGSKNLSSVTTESKDDKPEKVTPKVDNYVAAQTKLQEQNEKINQKLEQQKQQQQQSAPANNTANVQLAQGSKQSTKAKPTTDKSVQEKNRKMFQYYWEDYFNKGAKRNEPQFQNDISKLSFKDIISLTIMGIIQKPQEAQKTKVPLKVLCQSLQSCQNLKNLELVLAGIVLEDSDLVLVNQTLKTFDDIECLIIQFVGNQLTTQSMQKLDLNECNFSLLQEIHLDFHQNKLGTDCIKNLSKEFHKFISLRILDINLEDNQIGNLETNQIAGFLANDKIQLFRINLSNNLFTNQGLNNFGSAVCKHGQALRRLDLGLGANMVDNQGLEQLGQHLKLCAELSELTLALQDTQVTEQGAFQLLYSIFNLKFLYECNLILDEPLSWICQLIKQVFYVLNDYKRNFIYQIYQIKTKLGLNTAQISDLMQFYFQQRMIPFEDQSEDDNQFENMTPEEQMQYKQYLAEQQRQYLEQMDEEEKQEYLRHLQRSSQQHQQVIDEYDENLEEDDEQISEEQLKRMLEQQKQLKAKKTQDQKPKKPGFQPQQDYNQQEEDDFEQDYNF